MRKKRSKFYTFIFSLIPGAGHMFMGFMKMGVSLMSAFLTIIFFAAWLEISPLLFILPLLWFYSFFDCINRRYSTDEEFALLEDNYLFSLDKLLSTNMIIFQKRRLFAGVLILLLGMYLLWNNILNSLMRHIPQEIFWQIKDATRSIPQIILGVVIVVIGARLIMGKKKESGEDA